MRHLDFSQNPGLQKGFYFGLSEIVRDGESILSRLDLEQNKMGDTNVVDLAEALLESGRIEFLNLSKNKITNKGAKAVAKLVHYSESLRLLLLHYNRITGPGAVEIANAVAKSQALQIFDISYNAITSSGSSSNACSPERNSVAKDIKEAPDKNVKFSS